MDRGRDYQIAARAAMPGQSAPVEAMLNEGDWQKTLAIIQAGDRRAGLISAIGHRAMDFYMGLEPQHFATMAREMYMICAQNKGRVPNRCRLRAGEALLNVMDDSVRVASALARAKQTALLEHLEKCLTAFFDELTPEEFRRVAKVLAAMTQEKIEHSADGRLRTMEAIMRKIFSMVKIAAYSEQMRPAPKKMDDDDPYAQKARAELAEMDNDDIILPGEMRVRSA